MRNLLVTVYLNDDARNNNKCIFKRLIALSDALCVDYNVLDSSLRVLFGSSCIVVFELS